MMTYTTLLNFCILRRKRRIRPHRKKQRFWRSNERKNKYYIANIKFKNKIIVLNLYKNKKLKINKKILNEKNKT